MQDTRTDDQYPGAFEVGGEPTVRVDLHATCLPHSPELAKDNEALPDGLGDDVDGVVASSLRRGFGNRESLIRLTTEGFGATRPAQLFAAVAARVDATLAARAVEEAAWPTTDCDRLNTVFDELESRGYLARQDFLCCSNCAWREMKTLHQQLQHRGRTSKGCVFFDSQATDEAIDGGGLWLHFRDLGHPETGTVLVGREIVEVLRAHGLKPEWPGDPAVSIYVPVVWQRRFGPAFRGPDQGAALDVRRLTPTRRRRCARMRASAGRSRRPT